jgi:hypothetical protein
LEEYFPYFVRERLTRDLIVFNFQKEGQPLRKNVEQIFQAAGFLRYNALELQLVDRVIMNLHPEMFKQAVLLNRPGSRQERYQVVALIEERCSFQKERKMAEWDVPSVRGGGVHPRDASRVAVRKTDAAADAPVKCRGCGCPGHFRSCCPDKTPLSRGGQRPEGRKTPGAKVMGSICTVAAVPLDTPLWVMLELRMGKVLALVDTGP